MILAIEILGILCMCTLMFVLIWGFIAVNQILNQLKYKNYLMEKLTEHIYSLSNKSIKIHDVHSSPEV
jgi:hypothetical protein